MARANVNGVDLYYEVHGAGEALFLTHGSWGDETAWDAVVPALSERFEVITWDRRGHSRSSDGDGDGSYAEDAADLAGLIEHLGRSPAHVFGTSSGGTVVLNLVVDRPDLTTSAAVHEPAIESMLPDHATDDLARRVAVERQHMDKVGDMIRTGQAWAAAEYFIDNVAVGPGAWAQFPEDVKSAMAANAPTFAEEVSGWVGLEVDTATLAATEVPIMISIGTESPYLLLTRTRELVRRLPSAHVATMEGAGHVPYRTHPELWLDTLLGFYQAIAGTRR